MKTLLQITNIINLICKYIITILLIVVTVVLFAQVIARMLDTGAYWTEETARFSTIWLVMLGATVVLREGGLMKVDIIENFFPSAKKVMYYVETAVMLLYAGFLLYVSWGTLDMVTAQRSPNMGISMSFVYGSLTVMSILMIIYLIVQVVQKKEKGDS